MTPDRTVASWPNDINQAEFLEDTFKFQTFQLAAKYNRSERPIRRYKHYLRDHGFEVGDGLFPLASGPRYDKKMQIHADRVLILGDAEIPDHDAEIFDMALSIARHWELPELIINGDFAAMDAFSKWMRDHPKRRTYDDEISATKEALKVFLKYFEKIHMVNGNHERRLQHATEGQISFGQQLSEIYNVEFSQYSDGYLYSGGEKINFMHQKEYSIIPLSVPLKHIQAEHCHLACAHTHRLCFGWDRSGQYWLIETGHCRDVERTLYKQERKTGHPKWNAGFVMVIDGYPYLIDKRNFEFWIALRPNREEEIREEQTEKREKRKGRAGA